MAQTVPPSIADIHLLAQTLLSRLRVLVDTSTLTVARICSKAGKLDATKLDEHQLISYEIALASADLLAAEAACASVADVAELDARLFFTFTADALGNIVQRLNIIHADLDIDSSALQELAWGAEFTKFRQWTASRSVLGHLGTEVVHEGGNIGNINLADDIVMAHDAFHRFAETVIAPLAEKIHRHDLTVPEEILIGMREMGAFGLSIPEEYGGSASGTVQDLLMMIAVTETLSEASLAAAGSLITRPEILSRALLTGGTEAQKSYWLPKIAIGEPLCAIAITEPDFGSDVASLTFKGTKTEGGWLLDGAKTWCTFAGKAGVLMVVTRTDPDPAAGHRGLSIMLVEKPSFDGHEFNYTQAGGGRLSGRAIPTIGYRGMHSFDLHFERFFVADDRLLGETQGLGQGFYYTMAGMTGGRIQTAARASGVMRAALLTAVRYAKDRKVFGIPLIKQPLTQAKIAKMAALYAACKNLTYAIGARLGDGGAPMEASLVKLLACRSAEIISRDALQLHGGMGYAEESAISRYFVDARVLSIFEGAEETLALKVIAKGLYENALASDHPYDTQHRTQGTYAI
ncbi:acyl-CoA/acyl-ACP dehydrogenase [Alcaligenaceae bacterium CGII-47]|nr:acyl-CoA/acyl-ACP dehydrogenase [Alcaligenaceae bacterium CGII-47]